MERTNTPHTPDQQAGSPTWEPTQRVRPDEPASPEDLDTKTPPTDDTGFEPV